MCAGIEGLKEKATLEGRSEALQKTAQKLFEKHNSVEDIADTLEVDVEMVEEWLGLLKA